MEALYSETHQEVEKEPKKKKAYQNFSINCFAANHAYPLVQELMSQNPGWKETLSKDNFDMMYIWHNTCDTEIIDILKNKKGSIINRYPYV